MSLAVLLVDDHALVREGLRALLAGVGDVRVVGEAGDAALAFAQVETLRPDLVLMDIGMKDVNGIELTGRLRALHPTLRVLMLSMYANPEYVHRALAAGATGYVLKEAPSDQIIDAIRAVAAGRTFLGDGVVGRPSRGAEARPLLSHRETEILRGLARGLPSRQIADQLGMSVRTVETHRQNIRRKLNLGGQAELIKYAVEHAGDRAGPPGPTDA